MISYKKRSRQLTTLALTSTLVMGSFGLIPATAHATNGALSNAGFESYTGTSGVADSWTPYAPPEAATDLQVVSAPVHEGSRAQKVSASGLAQDAYADVHQLVAVDPGAQYAVSGMFNIESLTNATVQLYIDYYDASGTRIGAASTSHAQTTGGYIKLDNISVTPDNAASMRVYALLRATEAGGAGTFYVDNITIKKTAPALDNAGFETYTGTNGVADSWRVTVPATAQADLAVVTTPVAEGNHAQQVSGSNLQAGESIHINQTVAAEPNTSYTVTGRFHITALDKAKVQLYLDYYDLDGNWLQAYPVETTETTDGYTELTNEGITPAEAGYFRVYAVLRSTADGGSGTFYVDDIRVQKTPPAVAGISLIPLMQGNSKPVGVANARLSYISPYRAMDQNEQTYWESRPTDMWIEYDFQTPAVVKNYAIQASATPAHAPKDWIFQAFDGTSWVTLDSQQNISDWSALGTQTFTASNETAYTKYRLNIGQSVSLQYLQIAELKMFGAYAVPVTPRNFANPVNSDGTVTLTWSPLNGVIGYNLYQDGVKINAEPLTTTTYDVTGLTNHQVHRYAVSAVNPAGESALTPELLAMPFRDNLIPAMTADNAPSGATTSSYTSTSAFHAFDRDQSTSWQSQATDQWIEYDFQKPTVVKEYVVQGSLWDNRSPKHWTFQAFDGTGWIDLDTRTINYWWVTERKYFTIPNETAYNKYRLLVHSSYQNTYIEVGELEMAGTQ